MPFVGLSISKNFKFFKVFAFISTFEHLWPLDKKYLKVRNDYIIDRYIRLKTKSS